MCVCYIIYIDMNFTISLDGFLDSGSYIMDGIISLNDHIMFYEIILTVLVIWVLFSLILYKSPFSIKDLSHGSILEIIWTLIPAVILILIALPSFRLLYLMDDSLNESMSIKVIGHQWYWSYELADGTEFDSYLNPELRLGDLRNLDVDEYLIVPSNTYLRFLITSTDVIHSWSIPALGIKMDAIPGRINAFNVDIYRPGTYYGQCTELCGTSHAFMPIMLKVI